MRSGQVLFLFTTCLISLLNTAARGDDAESLMTAKARAQEIGQAMIKGDFAKIVDATPAELFGQVGGSRDEAIAAIRRAMEAMQAQKVSLKEYRVETPEKLYKTDSHYFAIVPTAVEMDSPKGKIRVKAYLLGISPDAGKTWKFVDSNGLIRNKEKVLEVLPKLPADLKLPERGMPEIVPN